MLVEVSPLTTTSFMCDLVFISLFNVGLMIVADKWGIIEWFEEKVKHRRCEFCIFFWVSFIEFTAMFYNGGPVHIQVLIYSFICGLVAASLSRFFLR